MLLLASHRSSPRGDRAGLYSRQQTSEAEWRLGPSCLGSCSAHFGTEGNGVRAGLRRARDLLLGLWSRGRLAERRVGGLEAVRCLQRVYAHLQRRCPLV